MQTTRRRRAKPTEGKTGWGYRFFLEDSPPLWGDDCGRFLLACWPSIFLFGPFFGRSEVGCGKRTSPGMLGDDREKQCRNRLVSILSNGAAPGIGRRYLPPRFFSCPLIAARKKKRKPKWNEKRSDEMTMKCACRERGDKDALRCAAFRKWLSAAGRMYYRYPWLPGLALELIASYHFRAVS